MDKETIRAKLDTLASNKYECDKACAEAIKTYLAGFTTYQLWVRLHHGAEKVCNWGDESRYEGATSSMRIEIGFYKANGKEAFGCDYDLEIFDNHISLGSGTMGSTTKKEYPEYVAEQILIGKTWENEDTIVALYNKIVDLSHEKEINELRCQLHDIEREEARKREEELKIDFANDFANNEYFAYYNKGSNVNRITAYRINKVTPKLVKSTYIEVFKFWGDNKFTTRERDNKNLDKDVIFYQYMNSKEGNTREPIAMFKDKATFDAWVEGLAA